MRLTRLTVGTVLPGVKQIALTLAVTVPDALTIAVWLDSANPDLDGRTGYGWLAAGGGIDRAVESAERDACRLAR